jgi:hypothetical protein
MKTEKTTVQCKEFNAANAAYIASGLVEAVEPNDTMLLLEKQTADRAKAQFVEAESKQAVLKQLDPNATNDKALGVYVRLEKTGGHYGNGCTGWKMIIGGGDNKTWLKIGNGRTLGLDAKQKAKALEKLAAVLEVQDARVVQAQAARTVANRYYEFVRVPRNKELVRGITGQSYVPEVNTLTGFRVEADGRLSCNGETFTVAQWEQVVALRASHAREVRLLKDSFKPAAPL